MLLSICYVLCNRCSYCTRENLGHFYLPSFPTCNLNEMLCHCLSFSLGPTTDNVEKTQERRGSIHMMTQKNSESLEQAGQIRLWLFRGQSTSFKEQFNSKTSMFHITNTLMCYVMASQIIDHTRLNCPTTHFSLTVPIVTRHMTVFKSDEEMLAMDCSVQCTVCTGVYITEHIYIKYIHVLNLKSVV